MNPKKTTNKNFTSIILSILKVQKVNLEASAFPAAHCWVSERMPNNAFLKNLQYPYLWYFLITAATTPPMRSSDFGLMVLYFGLAASRMMFLPSFRKYFIVHSPSTSAITISPVRGSRPFSTMTRSPAMMPAPVMESPLTVRRKEEPGRVIRYSSKEMTSRSSSSAGEGKPAVTSPTMGRARDRRVGLKYPRASFSSNPLARSLFTQKWTTLLDFTPR